MRGTRINIVKLESKIADRFHSTNENATFFTQVRFLEQIYGKVDWWGCYKGSEIICVWPVPLDIEGQPIQSYYFTYYVGPIWSSDALSRPSHSSFRLIVDTYNEFLNEFSREYKMISYSFSPQLTDVRPIIWRNKITKSEKHLIDIKYTSILELNTMENLIDNFRAVRRQELKKVNLDKFSIIENTINNDEIIELYKRNILLDTGIQYTETINKLQKFLELDRDLGLSSLCVSDLSTGALVGVFLFGIYDKTVNLILNNVDKEYKKKYSFLPTYLHFLTISKFLKEGKKRLDFNGANSFSIADSTHSFGAKPQIYFKIESQFGL